MEKENIGKPGTSQKTSMSDEERRQLAEKLDKDLDEFINNLPKRKYEDGWPEDRWEEEMEKHPFFMKKAPQPGDELHPLYEGLQKLKYDPDENEPEELAIAYKEDGNFNFKHKNYRLAIVAYTEGIKIKCGKPEIDANLFNNRAAAHYFLENYRSCLKDCEEALKLKSDYDKATQRAASCCFHLRQYEKAIEYCDKILDKQKDNKEILEIRQKSVTAAKLKERDDRKQKKEQVKKKVEEQVLLHEIKKRGIQLREGQITLEHLQPHFPQLVHHRVFLDEDRNLVWPVVLMYPEYKIMDYIVEFNENHTFQEQIGHIFQTSPEWDTERKYIPENLDIYYEITKTNTMVHVRNEETLGDVLSRKEYIVQGGTPSFIILVRGTSATEGFLSHYNS